MKKRRTILFVGMPNSPHAARWIDLIADEGWDLHFFPVYYAEPHELMRKMTVHQPWIQFKPRTYLLKLLEGVPNQDSRAQRHLKIKPIFPFPVVSPFNKILHRLRSKRLGESDVTAPLFLGPHVLAHVIKKLKPDLIHSMEFQHAGYNVLRAKELLGAQQFPKWLATNWGSDIFYYRHFPEHHQQLRRMLENLDYYSCECVRDIAIAQEMGLKAQVMPVLPNTGGFNLASISPLRSNIPASERKLIMIKGYENFAGRALTALEALVRCKDALQGYRIAVYAASTSVMARVEELRLFHGLDITILPYLTHSQMLTHFAHARLYIGISASDGISTSMLESMAMGAFPIQTDTACCDEWFDDGVSGFSVPHDNLDVIAGRITQALQDNTLVDRAGVINWETVCTRLDDRLLRPKEIDFYNQIFA